MNINGESVYGSKAWKTLGEGEIVNGKLKKLPGGSLGKNHAQFKFNAQDIRFTEGKNGDLYAFCMNVPTVGQKVIIHALSADKALTDHQIKKVTLLGYKGKLTWQQTAQGLEVTYPKNAKLKTAVVFRIK